MFNMALTIEEQRRRDVLAGFVGREKERKIFQRALQGLRHNPTERQTRMLLACALSGMGKSWLLVQFEEICKKEGKQYWPISKFQESLWH